MKSLLFCLLLGIVIGYFYGFHDAKTHRKNVVSRVVAKVGGSNRNNYRNDIDRRMEGLDR
jgi:hypothetical protein